MAHILHIKNMVCNRCIKVVKDELEHAGFKVKEIKLGEAVLEDENFHIGHVKKILERNGFELLEDKKVQLIDRIKTLIIETIHHKDLENFNRNYSDYLAEVLGKDYSHLSHLFSSTENITIEKYIILQKIERVKELIVYDELTLSEISYRLGYSSVAHLSRQFKQVTGLSPTEFKQMKHRPRQTLDNISP